MRALVLGMDGYLGWSLTCTLAQNQHDAMGIDSGLRRHLVAVEGSTSAINILTPDDRIDYLNSFYMTDIGYVLGDVSKDYSLLCEIIGTFEPDTIFQLAQMPSAPFSMKNRQTCLFTHRNNMNSMINLLYAVKEYAPAAHIIKIGTMGEYGQPNIPIPEGGCDIRIDGRTDHLPFPRMAGSWYHQTKVHDTHNIRMACNHWGLRCTDVMQGIVYGTRVKAMSPDAKSLATRLDFDECFGTIINRFVVQAVCEHPLTVYGQGTQVRSILPLQDSINCLMLLAKNPPAQGEYREVNQFHECRSLNEMAENVCEAYYELTGSRPTINYIANPRIEKERHFYSPEAKILKGLGYKNSDCIEKVIKCMLIDVFENKEVLKTYNDVFNPTITWACDKYKAGIIHRN